MPRPRLCTKIHAPRPLHPAPHTQLRQIKTPGAKITPTLKNHIYFMKMT